MSRCTRFLKIGPFVRDSITFFELTQYWLLEFPQCCNIFAQRENVTLIIRDRAMYRRLTEIFLYVCYSITFVSWLSGIAGGRSDEYHQARSYTIVLWWWCAIFEFFILRTTSTHVYFTGERSTGSKNFGKVCRTFVFFFGYNYWMLNEWSC